MVIYPHQNKETLSMVYGLYCSSILYILPSLITYTLTFGTYNSFTRTRVPFLWPWSRLFAYKPHINNFYHFLVAQVVDNLHAGRQEFIFKVYLVRYDYGWPADAKNQAISSHGIELIIPDYFCFGSRKFKAMSTKIDTDRYWWIWTIPF